MNDNNLAKLVEYFVKIVAVVFIFEVLFFFNNRFGLISYFNVTGTWVLTIWASVLTILFLVFSVLGLYQIESKIKELTSLKNVLADLQTELKTELASFKKSANDEKEKIVNQSKKEIARIINTSREKQNLYDKLTKIANTPSPLQRINQYTNFLQTSPNEEGINYAYIYICRGDAYRALNRYDRAVDDYEYAKKLTPEDEAPYIALGSHYASIKKYKESTIYFMKALKLQPKNAETYINLGNSFSAMGDYEKGQYYYKLALDMNIDSPVVYYNKALNILHSKEDPNNVITESLFKHCLTLDPLFYRAGICLAGIYKERNELPTAREEYTKLLSCLINNDSVNTVLQRGICNRIMGFNAAALTDFSNVYQLQPENVQNLSNLAQSHLALFHILEAEEFARIGQDEAKKQNFHDCDTEFSAVINKLNIIKAKAKYIKDSFQI